MFSVIVYGVGRQYRENEQIIKERYNVIAYLDRKENKDLPLRYVRFEELSKEVYDYILIASDCNFATMYFNLLNLGVSKDKIIGLDMNYANGVMHAVDEIKEFIQLETVEFGTSCSEESCYPFVCRAAVAKQSVYDNFRSNPIYTVVLEHVTYEHGEEYLKVINDNDRRMFDAEEWEEFGKNEQCGNPKTYLYNINGKELSFSPTTLRYVKVLSDLYQLYDTNKLKHIGEIGIGYGGQCRIIMSQLKGMESYTLIDLEEVLDLSQKYLSSFADEEKVRYVVGTKPLEIKEYDLIISNYAFSELRREVQDMYLEKVILHSKAGYITWNSVGQNRYNSYSVKELLDRIPNAKVLEENPLTHKDNCIIYWTSNECV